MQQVQDKLHFKIDTPSDKNLEDLFSGEKQSYGKEYPKPFVTSSTPKSGRTKKQRKHSRKAQKKARRVCA
jgi:hypothetical protein